MVAHTPETFGAYDLYAAAGGFYPTTTAMGAPVEYTMAPTSANINGYYQNYIPQSTANNQPMNMGGVVYYGYQNAGMMGNQKRNVRITRPDA